MFSPLVRFYLPQLTSFMDIGGLWIKRGLRLGDWQLECRQALQFLNQAIGATIIPLLISVAG